MQKNYLIIIVLLFLGSCSKKDGIEVDRFTLTEYEKECIPYSTNETVKFIHTNEFEFDLTVTDRHTEFRKTETYHRGDNYSVYEILSVELVSNIPELYINLAVTPEQFNPYMTISINEQYFFDIDLTSMSDIDTLTINGNKFNDVYQADYQALDTLIIRPKQILFNKEFGIIQITMTDNEEFTVN